MATTKTQVPSIPAIPKNEREAEAFNNSIKEILEVRLGRRGDPKDRAVTLRELIDSGLAKELLDNPFDPNAGVGVTDFASSSTFVDGKLDDTTSLVAPPTPTGLAASAGTTKIILNWNFAQISNLAHTEVWRSSDNNLSNAVRHDTTEAFVWVDSVDPGDEFYYWIRHVTTAGIFSQFAGSVNATAVLIAGTKIAADAITETKIADDAITTPKILTNAVTADSIASGTITASNIASNTLTSASGVFGAISASDISTGTLSASLINLSGSTLEVVSNQLRVNGEGIGTPQLANRAAGGNVFKAISGNTSFSTSNDIVISQSFTAGEGGTYGIFYISTFGDTIGVVNNQQVTFTLEKVASNGSVSNLSGVVTGQGTPEFTHPVTAAIVLNANEACTIRVRADDTGSGTMTSPVVFNQYLQVFRITKGDQT